MKTHIILTISMFCILSVGYLLRGETSEPSTSPQDNAMKISCTASLHQLVSEWAAEYNSLHPALYLRVDILPEADIDNAQIEQIRIMSTGSSLANSDEQAWSVTLGHNVIIPVMNEKNPFRDDLYQRGTMVDDLARLFGDTKQGTWGMLMGNETDPPVHIYLPDDDMTTSMVGKFLGVEVISTRNVTMSSEKEVINAILKDPYAIGFCRLGSLIDPSNREMTGGILPLPIDRNGNGNLDYMEDIYSSVNSLSRGIWIGKYPKALVGSIYFTAASPPVNENEMAFLRWILSDGQSYLNHYGYHDLMNSERFTQLAKLNPITQPLPPTVGRSPLWQPGMYVLVGVAIIIFTLILTLVYRRARIKSTNIVRLSEDTHPALNEDSFSAPGGLYYDRTHTWAFMEKDGSVKVGIDDFLQHVVGQVTRLKLKIRGEAVRKGEPLLSIIHKGKQLTIYSPICGSVTEINQQLYKDSSLINSSPYENGWVYVIEPENWPEQSRNLKTVVKYKNWISEEFVRLKDFLSVAMTNKQVDMSMIVLQDGGAVRDNILAEMSPDIWEDFQTYFLDLSK